MLAWLAHAGDFGLEITPQTPGAGINESMVLARASGKIHWRLRPPMVRSAPVRLVLQSHTLPGAFKRLESQIWNGLHRKNITP